MDKEALVPGTSTEDVEPPHEPRPVLETVQRIAIAVEGIDRTLSGRPPASGRNEALVELLGEARRSATSPGSVSNRLPR